jgi:RHS repeat-associated protein
MSTLGTTSSATGFVGRNPRPGKKSWHTTRRHVFDPVRRKLLQASGELAYDPRRRPWIGETVTTYSDGSPSSVHTTDFAYDGNQIVLQFDKDGTGNVTAADLSHRYLNGPAVDQVLADERVTLQNGTLATDEVLWPLADAQGTVRDVAKLSGTTAAVVDHVIYNNFGGVVNESDPSQGVLFKSTGCATDPATDIEFHEERDKNAGSVDWLKIDQSGYTSGTTNLRDYCGNDPINATDPSGLNSVPLSTAKAEAYLEGMIAMSDKAAIAAKQPTPITLNFTGRSKWNDIFKSPAGRAKLLLDPKYMEKTYGVPFDTQWDITRALIDQTWNKPGVLNSVSVLQIIGHRTLRPQKISFGSIATGRKDANGNEIMAEQYIDPANAAAFAEMLDAYSNWTSNAVIVLDSCLLGCYTKDAKNSVAQIIANVTGRPVLSPGGYSSGSLLNHTSKVVAWANPTTKLSVYETLDNQAAEAAKKDPYSDAPEDILAVKAIMYDSQNDVWYLTFPD